MTENKRFTITQDFEEHHRQIRDNGHIIMGCFIEPQAKVIVDMLNELNDENEQLKQQIKDLRLKVLDSIHEADEIQCSCNPCVVEECVKRVVE